MSFPPRPPPGMMPPPVMFGVGVVPPPLPPPHLVARPARPPTFVPRPRGPPPNIARDPNAAPPVTVFVGNISERAQDAMVRSLLASCGPLVSWKRVQGATGKLQAFGFCEYATPDHALRAIRILHDYQVGDKKLVVKVDAKTQETLDEYNKNRKKDAGKSPTSEDNSKEDYMDDEVRQADKITSEQIAAILKEHEKEMNNFVPLDGWKDRRPRTDEAEARQTGPKQSLDDVEMEDNKRDIIHREIDKFREIMKIREAEKEEEKKKRETSSSSNTTTTEQKRSRSRDRESRGRLEEPKDSSVRRRRSPSPPPRGSPSPPPPPSRGRSGSPRDRSSRSQSYRRRRTRSRSRSRSRSRDRDRRDRGRERETPSRKSTREIWREEEMEEEAKERKKAERKTREKEASYQERLRRWEDRESRKVKDYEKEADKEAKRQEDLEREARKIKEFLEDYDDDRDDPKYYKGQKLEARLAERNRELQKDVEDRMREKEEIEELKAQIIKEGYSDPSAELQRRLAEQERFNNPAAFQHLHQQQRNYEEIVLDDGVPVEGTNGSANIVDTYHHHRYNSGPHVTAPPIEAEDNSRHHQRYQSNNYNSDNDDDNGAQNYDASPSPIMMNEDSADFMQRSPRTTATAVTPIEAPVIKSPISSVPSSGKPAFQMTTKTRKIDVKDVFNQDDEEVTVAKKRKLPLPHASGSSSGASASASGSHDKSKSGKDSSEDKRRHIKSLIDKIPTQKSALFEYKVEWDLVDNVLMEKRIRPWVSKKIAEYIGEPEETLSDFICTKVLAGSSPKAILEDVQVVLDDEAEVFVVKLWRLLIYEIENKKMKSVGNA